MPDFTIPWSQAKICLLRTPKSRAGAGTAQPAHAFRRLSSIAMAVPVVWHNSYEVDIGPHVFPTRKYRLVRERLLSDGTISSGDLLEAAGHRRTSGARP